jgi:hypothetical protein
MLIQEALERLTGAELPGFTGAHDPGALTIALVQVPIALVLARLARRLVGAVRAFARAIVRRWQLGHGALRRGGVRRRRCSCRESPESRSATRSAACRSRPPDALPRGARGDHDRLR